jgi:hypothetical protein
LIGGIHLYICERSAESDQRRVGRFRVRGIGFDEQIQVLRCTRLAVERNRVTTND